MAHRSKKVKVIASKYSFLLSREKKTKIGESKWREEGRKKTYEERKEMQGEGRKYMQRGQGETRGKIQGKLNNRSGIP